MHGCLQKIDGKPLRKYYTVFPDTFRILPYGGNSRTVEHNKVVYLLGGSAALTEVYSNVHTLLNGCDYVTAVLLQCAFVFRESRSGVNGICKTG